LEFNLKIIVFAFLALCSFSVSAESADSMQELKAMLDKIHTLTGRFEQEINDSKGQPVQEASQGKFTLKRPGYFLWESEEPFNQVVIGTPDTLKIYDPDLEQLSIYPRGTNDQNNPAHLLSGDLSTLRANFLVEKQSAKKDELKFELIPVKADTSYKKIRFFFENERLKNLVFVDKLDQTTSIVFLSLESNSAIKASAFEFVAPEGTDIIHNE
jgi:outer membrane lipoprotein carrier protein